MSGRGRAGWTLAALAWAPAGPGAAAAVGDGAILDPLEYAALRGFGDAAPEGGALLRHRRATAESPAPAREPRAAIRRMRPASEVRDLAGRLTARRLDETDGVARPTTPPDLERDARSFRQGQRRFCVSDFQKWIYVSGIGREVRLEIFRCGATIELRAVIERRPAQAAPR